MPQASIHLLTVKENYTFPKTEIYCLAVKTT